jgi:GNAT superfamily N-acetyltransferase
MKTITLRPAEPEHDFGQLAAWFSSLEDEKTTELNLKEEYERDRERLLLEVAEADHGELLGFYWAKRNKVELDRLDFYLFVTPEQRGQGIGRQLYEALAQAAVAARTKKLRVSIWDTHPEDRAFAEQRGFSEKRHHFAMELNLAAFDDQPYGEVIARLKSEGFQFTSMEALGNTEDAQRKLHALNDAASASTPGQEGEHAWTSFEDFQKSVCQSDWYKPGGQIVAIDSATGDWAAMSAITRLEGNDYAYNLFTGVDERYRGRKLGQAVKVLALRYAREVLKANTVRTHHNFKNLPMIAIDQKLGYTMLPGTFLMEKNIGLNQAR